MRIVVIGGSGHVGSFLVPRLVRAGHDVVNLTRGARAHYVNDDAWSEVEQIQVDRAVDDAAGRFGQRVATLEADVVVDMICFTPESAAALVEALRGHSGHLIHCGTIWRYGLSLKQPMREDDTSPPFGEYGTQKVPGLGAELMHHVHADDVAQAFQLAVEQRDAASGESFNVVAPSALTVRGFLEIAAGWFGQTARIRSVSWAEFRSGTTAAYADSSWQHLSRSQYASIEKARTRLGYTPAYEPEAAVLDGIRWLTDHDRLQVANRLIV